MHRKNNISLYGLTLRIDQYGWSISRGIGIIIWAIFTSFSLGYTGAIMAKRDHWTDALSWINTRMGVAVLLIMLALNSPILDLRKISVSSQLSLIENGKMSYDELDIRYFRNQLAAPGYEALEQLKVQLKDSHPDFGKKLGDPNPQLYTGSILQNADEFINSLQILPKGQTLPEEFQTVLVEYYTQKLVLHDSEKYLIAIDLDSDEILEYILLQLADKRAYGNLFYYFEGEWQINRTIRPDLDLDEESIAALRRGEFEITTPRWNNLKLGNSVININ